jgi:hypothetical protein
MPLFTLNVSFGTQHWAHPDPVKVIFFAAGSLPLMAKITARAKEIIGPVCRAGGKGKSQRKKLGGHVAS